MDEHQVTQATANIPVIIGYLRTHLQDFVIRIEERPPNRVVFHLAHLTSSEHLILEVFCPTLGDRDNTSDSIQQNMNEIDPCSKA